MNDLNSITIIKYNHTAMTSSFSIEFFMNNPNRPVLQSLLLYSCKIVLQVCIMILMRIL